jgi:hypothetical protein
VCERAGISNRSAEYLAAYTSSNDEIPAISLDRVVKAAGLMECMLVPLIEHTAAAAGRIVQRCAPLGIEDPDHKLNDASGRVELAGFLACRVSEFADQVLVCGTKQVRKIQNPHQAGGIC